MERIAGSDVRESAGWIGWIAIIGYVIVAAIMWSMR